MRPFVHNDLEEAAFVQARLLDHFISLAREAQDREAGFTRDSLNDLIDELREERRAVGALTRPRLVPVGLD
ncbi:MAG TPA: hypothetical protein VEB20_14250 [Azospirillaceae bacterium]|nr:hypothetical protein [Azospirillaceae bacterium]